MPTNHQQQIWQDFCQYAKDRDIIFYYVGYFSQSLIATMADAVKSRIAHVGTAGNTSRKIFSTFIEMAQNIIHYSVDTYDNSGTEQHNLSHGAVIISFKDDHYYLQCANPVHKESAEKLRAKLEQLRTMTIEEIRQEYKVVLRAETPEDSKGAGLGLLTVARDASEPLEFDFLPVDDSGNIMFYLKATI